MFRKFAPGENVEPKLQQLKSSASPSRCAPPLVTKLERAAAQFRRQGELGQALRALEAALAIHCRLQGERSDVAIECSRQVADVCNSLGMQMLQRDDFVGCHALLKRAQARGLAC